MKSAAAPSSSRSPGAWEILNSSRERQKVEAHTVQFDVPVEKDKEVKLKYRVRVRS